MRYLLDSLLTVAMVFLMFILFSVMFAMCNSVNFRYPEAANFTNYGFIAGQKYVRTSERNPYNSPNHSNKDTITLLEVKGRWLKFDNGEILKLHSDSLNLYVWEKLK